MIAVDERTRDIQRRATDPAASVWVSANAGSGKTFVLARRVVRLLLAGADPGSILCLTFTKAAAAEMASRVFAILADWTRLGDAALDAILRDYQGVSGPAERVRARRLFAEALETPGGLKIQTIHAFCERLLHQFPLEANVAGSFEVLDERLSKVLIDESRREVVRLAAEAPSGPLGRAFARLLDAASDGGIEEALDAVIAKRDAVDEFVGSGSLDDALTRLGNALGLEPDDDPRRLQAAIGDGVAFSEGEIARLAEFLGAAGPKHRPLADPLLAFLASADVEARAGFWLDFLMSSGRKAMRAVSSLAPKPVLDGWPGLADRLLAEQARVEALLDRLAAIEAYRSTEALLTLGTAVTSRYEEAKRLRGGLDFEDLIVRTAALLTRSGASAWVQYKLDRGLEHILVDEAQDTSPRQWQVIGELISEFFAGHTSSPLDRTIFAVGDEKQSIYSFQGAVPAYFAEQRQRIGRKALGADAKFEALELTLSFRSTADVLGAVDRVFEPAHAHAGLTQEPARTQHQPARQGEAGRVTVWPPIVVEKREDPEEWHQPLDRLDEASPEVKLASRIAATIRGWIDRGERLEGTGRPIRPGGILILTRKRGAQTDAINRALKAADLPVAGADRLALATHIAVLDLLAAADFVLQPEDDLNLAALLRSPLFGLSEDDLETLAHGRPASLWRALRESELPAARLAAARLSEWRSRADFLRPYDFFARILGPDGGRRAFLARLGTEADDVLQEFLAQALAQESARIPTLQGFASWMRNAATEIKRDADLVRDEIRVMTVHGAKGLEADVVFVVDTGSKPVHASHDPKIVALADDRNDKSAPLVWLAPGAARPHVVVEALESLREKAREEYRRLLYVALTRARDRLIVCSTAKSGTGEERLWQHLVQEALETDARPVQVDLGGDVFETLEWRNDWAVAAAPPKDVDSASETVPALPDWLLRPPPLSEAIRRLAPSDAAGFAEAEPDAPAPTADPDRATRERQRIRGTLVHRLLQALPEHPAPERVAVADAFLAVATDWDMAERQRLSVALADLLADPAFAAVFAPGSRAEVPLAGFLMTASGPAEVSGRIDRLAVAGDRVLIVDFKTGHPPRGRVEAVPESYVVQLALYRALLAGLYPGSRIEAALLFTEAPELLILPEERLDACISRITGT